MNKGILAAITSVGIFCIAMGLSYPLLSLILEEMGVSASMIGLNTSMTPLGMILSSPFVPRLARRYGSWFLTVACFCITAVMLFLLAVVRDLIFWFPLRFILGIAINVIFIISEFWINQLAIPKIRGRIIGIYVTVAAAGFALGPMILIVSSTHGWMPFILGISVILVALPILIQAKEHLPEFDSEESSSVLLFLSFAPLLLFSVASAALFEQVTLSLLPIYGLRHGLSESATSLVLGILIVGNVLLLFPIGWLADLISRRVLLIILSFTAVSGSMLLPILIGGSMFLWPMLLIWGAVAYGTYTVALVELGDRFSGESLVAGCGAFSMMWGIGGTLGSPIAGIAMDFLGQEGLTVTLGLTFLALGIAAFFMPLSRLR
jgi:MFS family permease